MGPGPMSEIVVSGFYGTEPRESFLTGRVDDGAVVVESSRSHEGFIVMNEAPGYLKRTEINDGWRPGFKVMYDTDLFPFERVLEPGESFVTAGSSVAFFAEGRGGADPHWVMPSYGSEVLMKDGARYRPPWIYNTWEPFGRDINRAITLQLIEAAGRVGMDIFTIDDGWQARYGDNAVDLGRFPGGLDEIVRAVESRGMRLGLWVPLAAVSTAAEVYRSHPEWACTDASGKAKMTGTAGGPSVVMCLDSSYREAAAARVNDLVSRYHLRYVKLDLTTVFNAYGEAPGCNARGHGHRTWAESLEGIYEGIRYVTDAVHREHPDVLLDLTFEAWGQKHLIDDGLISAANLDWLSNVGDASPGDAGPRAARKLLYDRSLAIPTETMLIGNLRAEGRQTVERVATAMGSGPLLLGDLRKLTGAEQSECGKIVAAFKALRDGIPLNEGFFPLGNWRQPSVASWDGFARLGRDGEGLVALFKNESAEEDAAFNLAAFPDGEFEVRSMLSGRSEGRFSGQQFRSGVTFPLPTGSTVELLEIRKADPAATLPSPRP